MCHVSTLLLFRHNIRLSVYCGVHLNPLRKPITQEVRSNKFSMSRLSRDHAPPPRTPSKIPVTPAAAKRALSEEQKQELHEAFELFDSEKTGKIDYHELKVAMRSLGFDVKKPEVLSLMEEHDVTGSGYIGYDEFVDIMARRIAERSPEEELRKAFELFDEDGTGRISLRNLRRVVSVSGVAVFTGCLRVVRQQRRAEFLIDARHLPSSSSPQAQRQAPPGQR